MIWYKPSWKYTSKFIKFKFETNKFNFIPIWLSLPSGCSIKYYYKLSIWDIWTEFLPNLDITISNSLWLYIQIELTGTGLDTPKLDDYKIKYYEI